MSTLEEFQIFGNELTGTVPGEVCDLQSLETEIPFADCYKSKDVCTYNDLCLESPKPTEAPSYMPSTVHSAEPSATPTSLPSAKVEAPSNKPSEVDSSTPSMVPSSTPSKVSSCPEKDTDVCIAIDRSGSVCAPPGKSYSCGGDPNCGCENWDFLRDFTNTFIQAFSDTERKRRYALVKFASTARVASSLVNATDAFDSVTNLRYSSGWTNTAEAIEKCRDELSSSNAKQKTVVLLTDGAPTRPLNRTYAMAKAEEQAAFAKDEDTSIVGVFVSTESKDTSVLETLTTPGLFLEVNDFKDLNASVSSSLVNLLQCLQPPAGNR